MNSSGPTLVSEILEPGQWTGPIDDLITLDYDGRYRRSVVLTAYHGLRFILELQPGRLLPNGCALKLADGRLVEVIAAPEDLLEIRADDASSLLRISWHIGNRHLAAQFLANRILIRCDRLIGAMLDGLGAVIAEISAPFDPEGDAYIDAHRNQLHNKEHEH